MSVVEMRILRWISKNTSKYKIRNEEIHLKIGVAPYRWKDDEQLLQMAWSYAEQSN